MRRPTSVEVMLLSAIALWALNLTVSRYILTHGFQPLAYSTVRYGLASLVFIPVIPVIGACIDFLRRKEWEFAAASIAVLALLAYALSRLS